jgi:hypothetical protein
LPGSSANPNRYGGSSKASPINFLTLQSDESLTQKVHGSKIDRVYDDAGNVTEAHEHAGDFKEG